MTWLKVLCVVAMSAFSGTSLAQNGQTYYLGSGDVIRILVHGEPDLSFDSKIGQEGVIRYPFLGDIQVIGLRVNEVAALITDGLKGDYLDQPSVNVSVVQYRPFFIMGEVKNPQDYPYQPGLTVAQAIAIAGGMTERADREKIELKRMVSGEIRVLSRVPLDYAVQPGDTITIAESFF